jgi:Protein of unknown function (DUF1759)
MITKIQYLRCSLSDSAHNLIALIVFTNEGFDIAIKMLRREYDRPSQSGWQVAQRFFKTNITINNEQKSLIVAGICFKQQ